MVVTQEAQASRIGLDVLKKAAMRWMPRWQWGLPWR